MGRSAPVVLAGLLLAACSGPTPVTTVPYRQSFETALGPEWWSTGGGWSVLEGRLANNGAHNVPLWLSAALPADVRVTFDAVSSSDAVDIKFEIFGDGRQHQSGYVVILAGWSNSRSIIARLDEHGPLRTATDDVALRAEVQRAPEEARTRYAGRREVVSKPVRMEPRRLYHLRFERRRGELRFFVDDELHLEYFDPSPLSGAGHDRFAFNNWESEVTFDNLQIEPL